MKRKAQEDEEAEGGCSDNRMELDEPQIANNHSDSVPYELATHVVKVRRSGTLTNVSQLWDMTGTGALAKSVQDLMQHDRSKFTRMSSVNSFNEVRNLVRTVVNPSVCVGFDFCFVFT